MNFLKQTNKRVMLSLAIIATMSFSSCKNETKKEIKTTTNKVATTETSFGVRGNCGMCKKAIEKAVNNLDGTVECNWDKEKKKISVSFDNTKTNLDAIHSAIANAGYDTDKLSASNEAYKDLPSCCKYDHSMKMNLKDGEKVDEKNSH